MQSPEILALSEQDKLEVLRRLDQFRKWRSLDDKRYCLSCGKIINGHDLRVIGGTRGIGPLRAICATERCPAIPMDWVLPTAEVLKKSAELAPPIVVAQAEIKTVPRRRPIKLAIRSLATRLRMFV
jgi:hypothetical protein